MTTTTTDQTDLEAVDQIDAPADEVQTTDAPEDAETFPREYVVKLRDENAKYRQRAGQTDDLAHRLHLELVKGTGRLADATDLPFDDAHLTDADALTAAVDALLTSKPHLASRKPTGNIGQGASVVADTLSLSGLLRSNAR
jgi:hypothetical protein